MYMGMEPTDVASAPSSPFAEVQFDPMDVLVEDAVSLESGELIHDFIDTLFSSQQLPALGAHCPAACIS